jgi:methylphosphotriester-DNA--protein-cysteine methyltransferase
MARAFAARDARYDGRFVGAVRTTGIYCRPSCSCRKPRPENVRFFRSGAAAAAAGFRPCKRCRPELAGGPREAAARLAAASAALARREPGRAWTPAALARALAVSESVLLRAFRAAGAGTPMSAVRRARLARARVALAGGATVLEAALDAGYRSPSAFTRAFRALTGSTPSAWRRNGRTPGRNR